MFIAKHFYFLSQLSQERDVHFAPDGALQNLWPCGAINITRLTTLRRSPAWLAIYSRGTPGQFPFALVARLIVSRRFTVSAHV